MELLIPVQFKTARTQAEVFVELLLMQLDLSFGRGLFACTSCETSTCYKTKTHASLNKVETG